MTIEESVLGCFKYPVKKFFDERGSFQELFKGDWAKQGNLSRSKKNVVRGLHFQRNKPQGKLVQVIHGTVVDVVVDVREKSKNFGKVESFVLTPYIDFALFIPPGFAHGFWVLSDLAIFHYVCSEEYSAPDDSGINPLDDNLNLPWRGHGGLILSEKDKKLPKLSDSLGALL